MKILLVSSGSGSRGGGEIYLKLLAKGLVERGHDMHVLLGDDRRLDELAAAVDDLATVHRLEIRNTFARPTRTIGAILDHQQQRRLEGFFRQLAPDIVHINQQVAEDGLDLLLAAHRSSLPYVSTIHIARSSQSLAAKLGRLRDGVAATVLRHVKARHIVVAGHSHRDLVSRLGQSCAERVRIVHNGVGHSRDCSMEARAAAREAWHMSNGEVVLGCVGRLDEQKNPLFAVQLCSELRRRGKPVRLVWVGDGPLRCRFLKLVSELGLGEAVVVHGWSDDVEGLLAGLDIFLLPSRFEGLPLALLEAMHAGLPVCVSDTDGLSEAVQDGVHGLSFRSGDLMHWVLGVEHLIEHPPLRKQLGTAARERASSEFSLERMCRDTEDFYRRVLDEHAVDH